MIGLDHLADLRVVPAEALAEIVRMKMVRIVRLHVENADRVRIRLLDILRKIVAGIDANQIDLLEAEIERQLHTGERHRAAGIGRLRGVGREVEAMREALARQMVEEDRVAALIEAIAKIGGEELRRSLERIDRTPPVLRDEMVFDHVEGGTPIELRRLEEEAVDRERDFVLQNGQVGPVQARSVPDDEAALAALVSLAQSSQCRSIDRIQTVPINAPDDTDSGQAFIDGDLVRGQKDIRACRQRRDDLAILALPRIVLGIGVVHAGYSGAGAVGIKNAVGHFGRWDWSERRFKPSTPLVVDGRSHTGAEPVNAFDMRRRWMSDVRR